MTLRTELEDLGLETGQRRPDGGLSEPSTEGYHGLRPDGEQLEVLGIEATTELFDGRVRALWKGPGQKEVGCQGEIRGNHELVYERVALRTENPSRSK